MPTPRIAASRNLAAEAIREFVENNEWQIHEIKAAIKEANAGDFASDEELAALAKKFIVPYRVRGDTIEILRVFHTSRRLPQKG